MARARKVSIHRVPYLQDSVIEDHARLLIDEWGEQFEPVIGPPVPIEEMLESLLGLTCRIVDLRTEYGSPDLLGAIWFGSRLVKIDQSLDPDVNPKLLGRYRYTIAHEIGHWRLHRVHLAGDPNAMKLFDENGEPAFVCRSTQKPREEWQADTFAEYVLMPEKFVYDAWRDWRGTDEPVRIGDLPVGDYHGEKVADQNMAMERFCKPLAERFEVSAQAMRIRLQKLGLLVEEIEPRLF